MKPVPADQTVVYLAIDPGKTTGVAWLVDGEFGFGEALGRFEFYRQLRTWTSLGHRLEIVCEDWNVRADTAKKTAQADPWRIIGYVEGWADQLGIEFTLQPPGSAKSFGTDQKLRILGWEATTPGGHARDAARHLLTYLVRRYPGDDQVGGRLLTTLMEKL